MMPPSRPFPVPGAGERGQKLATIISEILGLPANDLGAIHQFIREAKIGRQTQTKSDLIAHIVSLLEGLSPEYVAQVAAYVEWCHECQDWWDHSTPEEHYQETTRRT